MKPALQPIVGGWDSLDTESEEPDSLITMASRLALEFDQRNFPGTTVPQINCDNENHEIQDVMSSIINNEDIMFIVVAAPEDNDIATFALTSSCQKIIDWANVPVLIVPDGAAVKNPEKIAFLANLDDRDATYINSLLNITQDFSADIMVSNINNEGYDQQHREQKLINSLHYNVDYGKAYYRSISDERMINGWKWLRENKKCDMLAITQQSHQSLKRFFSLANTPAATHHLTIPLMILPATA